MVSGIFLSFCSTIVLAVKRSALTWCKLFHLGNRVDFCVASYKEHPFSSCQNGTLMMLWGIPHFILQLKPIYLQAPGKRHMTLDEPIRTGCSPSPRPPIVIGSGMGTWPIRDKKMHWDFFFFFPPETSGERHILLLVGFWRKENMRLGEANLTETWRLRMKPAAWKRAEW